MKVRVILADDHKIMRDGLRSLLEKEDSIEVIAEATNGRMAVDLAIKLKPDIIIMDVSMPDLNGVNATRKVSEVIPDVKVIALSMYSDRRFVTGMLKAGASAYLLKDCAYEDLVFAIRAVSMNETYLSPSITTMIVKDYLKKSIFDESWLPSILTPREVEIFQLLAEGKNAKEIAVQINVSPKTVDTHRLNIMNKLNINNIAELTKYALREGITSINHQ